jgi:hypothetical protein
VKSCLTLTEISAKERQPNVTLVVPVLHFATLGQSAAENWVLVGTKEDWESSEVDLLCL